jgi:hypothetical protein
MSTFDMRFDLEENIESFSVLVLHLRYLFVQSLGSFIS